MNSLNKLPKEILEKYTGKNIVVYFYPKDNTSGCTTQAIEFSELKTEFEKLNTVIIGISKDTDASHKKFIEKQNLTIELLSDVNKEIHNEFDVIHEKNMYGKKVLGTVRSTFVFNSTGELVKEYRKVKAKGHAQEVYQFVKDMKCE